MIMASSLLAGDCCTLAGETKGMMTRSLMRDDALGLIALAIGLMLELLRDETGKSIGWLPLDTASRWLRVLSIVFLVPVGMRWTSGVVLPICSGWAQLMFGNGLSYDWPIILIGGYHNTWMLTAASYAATYSIDDGQGLTLLLTTLSQLCVIGVVVLWHQPDTLRKLGIELVSLPYHIKVPDSGKYEQNEWIQSHELLGYNKMNKPNRKSDNRPEISVSTRVAEPATDRQLEYDSGYNSSGDDELAAALAAAPAAETTAQALEAAAALSAKETSGETAAIQGAAVAAVGGLVAKMGIIPAEDIERLFNDFDDDEGLDPELKAAQDKELAEFSSRLGVSLLDAQITQ